MKTIGLDISVLNDKQRTGIGVYTYELIKALLKINKTDKFILFGIATLSTYDYLKNLEFKNYSNVEMKIYKMPAKFFRTAFLTWQKLNWPKIEKFIGPVDIFHSFNWFMPPQKGGKRVATVFDLTSILYPEWHDKRTTQLDQERFKNIAQNADLVVSISECTKKDFLKFKPNGRVEVVYPGGREMGEKTIKEDKVMRKYRLKPGYLLYVGTIEPRKNLERLIRSFSRAALGVHQGLPLPKLVLVGGKGWLSDDIYKLPKQLGVEGQVKFLGFVPDEDLKALYKNALCFIYPSFYEGFGIPVLEAMSCGCPVIISNTSSLPEVGGKAVAYVNPELLEEMVWEVREVMESKEVRERMIIKGFEQAEKFSWEKSAKKLNKLYQGISA